jgi:hypothetical protein
MQYEELIQFEPIDSIIELQEANDADIAKQLVQTFVLPEDMAEKLVSITIPHLQFMEPIENTQKHARGSAQAELYPNDIDKFIVPLLESSKQTAIGNLVRKSLEKQKESKRLLAQAKTRVEELIEKAAGS